MIKIEVVLHFNFNEDEVEGKGRELLDNIREEFKKAVVDSDFSENCKVVRVKLIEEEVEAF